MWSSSDGGWLATLGWVQSAVANVLRRPYDPLTKDSRVCSVPVAGDVEAIWLVIDTSAAANFDVVTDGNAGHRLGLVVLMRRRVT